MSTDTQQEMPMGTQPAKEHEWLHQLLGEWRVESEIRMGPDQPVVTGSGTEKVELLGGLWALTSGTGTMPNGEQMEYRSGLGYDVSFKGYRGFWVASVSSHLWKYEGELSGDGRVMTLNCEGPDMEKEGQTAYYRDVIEIVDKDHRIMRSYGQGADGQWQEFMTAHYYRI